jgi:phage head maturation protease
METMQQSKLMNRLKQESGQFRPEHAYVVRDSGADGRPLLGKATLAAVDYSGIDQAAMSVPCIISTTDRDRYGDWIESRGCLTEQYAVNPVVLLNHNSGGLPIGKAEDTNGNLTVRIEDKRVLARTFFSQRSETAAQVFHLNVERVMRGVSVGFNPIPEDTEEVYDQSSPPQFLGNLFSRWHLVEYSHVTIPANYMCTNLEEAGWVAEKLRTLLSRNLIDGRPIVPELVRSLSPFVPPRSLPWTPATSRQPETRKPIDAHVRATLATSLRVGCRTAMNTFRPSRYRGSE